MFQYSLSELSQTFLGVLGWFSLIFLPGAWITFGLPLNELKFWIRFLIGMSLAPFVVNLQFYALRLSGVTFENTVLFLVVINLPALFLIWKQRSKNWIPDYNLLLAGGFVLLIAVICFAPQLINGQTRMFTGHAWMHGDLIYLIKNGDLWLEEPELAGIKLAYPWAGHVFQAVLSYLLNSASVTGYIWTNLIWLLCFFGFSFYIVEELGGNNFSKISSFVWLCFGLNFIGYILQHTLPLAFTQKLWIGGDYRYTPWIIYFYFFEQMIFGLATFGALAYVLIKIQAQELDYRYLILIALLLCAIVIIYPIIFLPAFMITFAKLVLLLVNRNNVAEKKSFRKIISLTLILVAVGVIALIYLKFLTVSRVTESIKFPSLSINSAKYFLLKSQGSIVALSLLLAGFCLTIRKLWAEKRNAVTILIVGAFGSLLLNLFLEIPFWVNEYKFLFTAAICLSPFPALASEPLIKHLKKKSLPVSVLFLIVLSAPLVHKLFMDYPWQNAKPPAINDQNFDLRLDDTEPFAALCDTIRQKTSVDTILVIEQSEIHFPTLTGRKLYAPPKQEGLRAGVNISSNDLLARVRGYDKKIIDDRKTVVNDFFNTFESDQRAESLEQMLSLNRPIAIVLELPRHRTLNEWLGTNGYVQLFNDDNKVVWLIETQTTAN